MKPFFIMILNIDPLKSAAASIGSAAAGSFTKYYCFAPIGFFSLETANTFFQHAAWSVAIIAGIVSIINGVRTWKKKK